MTASVAALIAEARKHVGYAEGPKKNNIFGVWYGANHSAWCAMFVSYCMNKSGAGTLIKGAQNAKGYASCGAGIKFFKKKKAWFAIKDAKPGDHAFFDWDHDGSQDHVGIVVRNNPRKKMVLTIEGNTGHTSYANGGQVKEQWRNYSVIMGVGRPAWPTEAPKEALPVSAPAEVSKALGEAPVASPTPVVAKAAAVVTPSIVQKPVKATVKSPVSPKKTPQVKAVLTPMSNTELENLPENYKPRAERSAWAKTLDIVLRLLAGGVAAFLLPFGSIALTGLPSWLSIPLAAALGWFAFRASSILNTYTRFGRLTERDIDSNFTSIAKKK